MEPLPEKFSKHRQRIMLGVSLVLLSGALAACAALDLRTRVSLLAGSLTGMKCLVSSVSPCFPFGIKATNVIVCSTSGEPLFEAKELRTQLNILRYLRNNSSESHLLGAIHGDRIKVVLTRNETGEWDLPKLSNTQAISGSADQGIACRRRYLFTNVTMVIKTGKGVSEHFYKSIDLESAPDKDSATLKLSTLEGSARITVTKGIVKRYELQADRFPAGLLAPFPLPLENLILNGTMRATTSDDSHFSVEGSGTITTQHLRSKTISSRTIDDLTLPFDLKGDLSSSGIQNFVLKTSFADQTAMVQGDIRGWDKPVIDATARFLDFSYDKAISALPSSLHPDLPDIRLSGSMTGTFRLHLDLANPASLDYSYTGRMDRLKILHLGQELDMHRLKGPFLHKVRINPEKPASILLSPDNPDFTPYSKIPVSLKSAVMAAEDLGFFSHRGFSKNHIRGSLVENLKAGKVVRGASTISMQLAKNLYLSPERTLSRKLEEALITVALEQDLDKKRILEIYLNIIEWGNGIYGIGPAARYYFGKRPAALSPLESAFLASIIARPRIWRPYPLSRLGPGWREYLRVILCKMYQMDAADIDDLVKAGVSEARIERLTGKETGTGREDATSFPRTGSPPLSGVAF